MKTEKKPTHTPGPRLDYKVAKTLIHLDLFEGPENAPTVTPLGSVTKDKLPNIERLSRLIAAAPNLLMAVKFSHDSLIDALGDCGLTSKEIDEHQTIISIRAALAKAEQGDR